MHITQITNSDNITTVSWADDVLYITFKRGSKTYRYRGVPFEAYTALVNAESVGKHFHANIKDNYPGEAISTADAIAAGMASC